MAQAVAETAPLDIAEETRRLVTGKVMLLTLLGHMMCHLDRLNLGFASLEMNKALSLGPEVYGFGAGIFFLGYAFFEIPSNFALRRFGAPNWLGRIMVTWGLISCGMAFVVGETSFYVMRFLLGVAEAGFTPGIIYYFSTWYARQHRSRALGLWLMGPSLAGIVGAPLSGWLLQLNGLGLSNWQWLFVLEGLPAVILGLLLPLLLPANPETSEWLPAANREWLSREIRAEALEKEGKTERHSFVAALRSSTIWIYGAAYFCLSIGLFSLFFWSPQIIKSGFPNLSTMQISTLSALPFVGSLIAVNVIGRTSDRTGDRRWHACVSGILAGTLLIIGTQTPNPIFGLVAIIVAIACSYAFITVFWPNPMAVLGGSAAAGGLALINSVGQIGGFTGPYVVGLLRGYTGSFTASITFFAIFFIIMGLIPLCFPRLFPHGRQMG